MGMYRSNRKSVVNELFEILYTFESSSLRKIRIVSYD